MTKNHVKQLGSNALPILTNKADTDVLHFPSLCKSVMCAATSVVQLPVRRNALPSKYNARSATHQTGQAFSLQYIPHFPASL